MSAELFSVFYQFADVFAFLILSAAGLAIVFGMMGVINMAHGEFIMCGAYVTVGLVKLGVPLAIAQALAAVTAGLIGVVVEYLIVRRFYKRPLDSLLATWGLSLIVTQSMLLIVGSSITGIGTPEGSFAIGGYYLLDVSPGAVRMRGCGAGRSLCDLHEDAVRRDGARDDAECARWPGHWVRARDASMRSVSASAPASRGFAARFTRRR